MPRQDAEKKIRSWRRRCCRYLFIVCIVAFIGFILINIGLNSPLVRGKLEQKLKEKTGLTWEVKVVRWTPFTGLSVRNVSTEEYRVGESGEKTLGCRITAEYIQVTPYWKECFTGNFQIREVEVRNMLCDVEQKWLENHFSGASSKQDLSPNVPKPTIPEPEPKPKPPVKPESPVKPPVKPKPTPPVKPKPPTKPVEQPKPAPPVQPQVELAKVLKLKNVRFIVRDEQNVTFDSKELEMLIPFSGEKAEGYVRQADGEQKYPLNWTGQRLHFDQSDIEYMGVKLEVKALLSPKKSQPFFINVAIPKQSYEKQIEWPFKSNVRASSLTGILECRGSLIHPASWRGGMRLYGENVTVDELMKHLEFDFDTFRINARISGPNVIIDNAEARGHELNLFGNGVVQRNLTGYGVLRVIANPRKRTLLEKVHHGSRVNFSLKLHKYHMLWPLDNHDYWIADFFLGGKIMAPMLRHERSETWIPLKEIYQHAMDYKDAELREDGLIP